MKTRRILAHGATLLGAVMILLGLISLLSLPQVQTLNQFIGLLVFIVAGLWIGYKIFINGMDYVQRGYVMDRAEEAVTKLASKLKHDQEVSKHTVLPWNIILESNKKMLVKHENIIEILYTFRQKVLTKEEHERLEVVELYHYECIGKLQQSIQRMEDKVAGDKSEG